ncbi:PAS domain-containing sensor histidine kinase [Brevirhabdus pacifica]|uniref:histidine kinase n=1 Tax=Brevirhabdus pacifica TaxID=1267768 RepID=A0A1U7DF66_9RHOB|nr:ATP-binding protein [Brevirhabdus pacifica]APX88601.1 PAS domain-containing sensor histidine kinase [Brevirhabdus pacifica]OWU79885.1 ATPase [Loktanella sp. 22II-4b]PJJ86905.1 two-component system nitrogen regulation sensor histidine kinase GlnL [Brevirhabdus pacifica]
MTLLPETIWASLPVPAVIVDVDDRIDLVNPAAELFLNSSARALRGAPVWDRIHVDAPLEGAFERVRANQAPLFVNDVDVGCGERPPMQCNLQIAPLVDDGTRVLILLEPREFADRLGRALSSKSAARSAIGMSEMLAHEIKNPLAGITGAAQLLSMNLPAADREMTDLIVAETRRITSLLDQVEQFGNLRPPQRQPINLHDVLDRVRKSAMLGFAAHMQIVEDYDPSLPNTLGDADQLVQVFQNLIKNAAEASPQGGTIRIRTFYELSIRVKRRDGTGGPVPLHVEIIDDGPGLPPEIAGEVFEPFVSGRENGTGLGLALVSKIVSEHDGWISLDTVPGRTVFRISLPMARADQETN